MKKIGKRILIIVGVLAMLFISVIVIYALTFNPNDYKPQIIRLVQEKKQRTLTLEGDIKLLFFPKLGVDLGRSWISERNGDRQFASLQHARFYFSWLPLLRRQVVIDTVSLEGVGAILIRHPDGSTNFADILEKEANSWLKFNVQTLKLMHGVLVFDDQLSDRKLVFTEIDLRHRAQQDITINSKLTSARPDVNLILKLSSAINTGESQRLDLKGLKLSLIGRLAGVTNLDAQLQGNFSGRGAGDWSAQLLKFSASGKTQSRDFILNGALPALQVNATEFLVESFDLETTFQNAKDSLTLAAHIPAARGLKNAAFATNGAFTWRGRQGKVSFVGDAKTTFSIDVAKQAAAFPEFSARMEIKEPTRLKIPLVFSLNGNGTIGWQPFLSTLNLSGTLSDTQIQAAGSAMGAPLRVTFKMFINQLDVDRYLKKGAGNANTTPPSEWNLTALKDLNVTGKIDIGQLTYAQTRARNVTLTLQ